MNYDALLKIVYAIYNGAEQMVQIPATVYNPVCVYVCVRKCERVCECVCEFASSLNVM